MNLHRMSSVVNWGLLTRISSTRSLRVICAQGLEKQVSEINAADLPRLSWMRVIAGGALWAVVYNLVWAWLGSFSCAGNGAMHLSPSTVRCFLLRTSGFSGWR